MDREYAKVTDEVIAELKVIVGDNNVIFGDSEKLQDYKGDTFAALMPDIPGPEAAVKPETTEQVSRIMKLANENNIPVTPRGAGSGLAGAAIADLGGIVLSLEKMNKIIEIDKTDRIAIVEAGVITNELCEKAEEAGLTYAGYPMSTHSSFIGGNVATNAGGGKVIRYGNTRMHILGLEVVLPSGEVIELGGRFRKSTWGYDLMHLMIGSEGTLGIITKVTVNLISGSGKTVDLIVPFPDITSAVDSVAKIIVDGGIIPEAVEYMDRLCLTQAAKYHETTVPFMDNEDVVAFLIIQLLGDTQENLENLYEKAGEICLENGALDVFVAESRADSENIWKVREEFGPGLGITGRMPVFGGDIIVPFSKIPDIMQEIKNLEKKYNTEIPTVAHIADGNLHSAILKPEDVAPEDWRPLAEKIFDEMTEIAFKLGGIGSGEHGVGLLKKETFLKSKTEAELNIMRQIKKAFDPNYILNPGKIF
ncbi:MAG: FAD-binding oxidoreductase [Deltaproteobacteria bacterium]|nr:FAD-binding oxidoreductase [Deltaproteobacteria bacterium]